MTFLIYLSSLRNDFIREWDDKTYVYNNPHIRSFDFDFIKWAFSDFYQANWHPLTWISHGLDYAIWGLNPAGHHLTNIILHASNTALVVLISARLIERCREGTAPGEALARLKGQGILIAAGVTGLLFGLHPIHVESVAWVAERKDLLCALFFLLSVTTYLKYSGAVSADPASPSPFRRRDYLITLPFFILALLSKPMAVSLPVVLLILDWCPLGRIRSLRSFRTVLVEKGPFIILSLLSSVVTIEAQKAAMELMNVVPLSTRLLVAVKSVLAYLWKMILPLDLVPYYSYPGNVSLFSAEYLSAIAVVLGITAACIAVVAKKKLFLAAWGYYLITLLPVLGIVQVGAQSMADRYMYLPSIAPFLVAGLGTASVWVRISASKKRRVLFQCAFFFISILTFTSLSYATLEQLKIWRDTFVFWNYVIEKEPSTVPFAYFNRGNALAEIGHPDRALDDYDRAIALSPSYREAYNNRGSTYDRMGRFDRAIADYTKAIALSQNDPQIFVNRGLTYLKLGQAQLAIEDFNRACELGDSFGCNAPRYLPQ
ncbi:MAG TPA: tetratricopeptide repeat protein [Thermodesulfovibrionales bacterium]|nr:tetratricopeptide repeat protein [Thermodesulfovibrionales bacterium]